MRTIFLCGGSCVGKTFLSTLWEQSDLLVRTLHVGQRMRDYVGEEQMLDLSRPLAPVELMDMVERMIDDFVAECGRDGSVDTVIVDSLKVPEQVGIIRRHGGCLVSVTSSMADVERRIMSREGSSGLLARMVGAGSIASAFDLYTAAKRDGVPTVRISNGGCYPTDEVITWTRLCVLLDGTIRST